MEHYDAIICGGGPAGSAAALALARSGRSVAVLDRARFPRPKLCGGLLTWKTVRLLEAALGLDLETLTRAGAVVGRADRYAIRSLDRTLAEGSLSFPFHFVERTVFDDLLLRTAESANADIVEGVEVVETDAENGVVKAKDGQRFAAKWIIGADGANAATRRAVPGLDRERFHRYMAPALEIALPAAAFPRSVTFPELYVGFLDAGYGWVFPRGGAVVVGICGLRRNRENFSRIFADYLDFLGIDPTDRPEPHGHPLPYGNYLREPAYHRLLLAGDAAGLVEPLFGEGIFFSLCSGWYAGRAVAEALARNVEPAPRYLRRLHREILPELRASDLLRRFLFRAMHHAGTRSLAWFVNSAAGPLSDMVHGKRSYVWLRKKHWDFLEA